MNSLKQHWSPDTVYRDSREDCLRGERQRKEREKQQAQCAFFDTDLCLQVWRKMLTRLFCLVKCWQQKLHIYVSFQIACSIKYKLLCSEQSDVSIRLMRVHRRMCLVRGDSLLGPCCVERLMLWPPHPNTSQYKSISCHDKDKPCKDCLLFVGLLQVLV